MPESAPVMVILTARWHPPNPEGIRRAAAVAHLSVRPALGPEERIYRINEVRLFGTCRSQEAGVEGSFVVEFRYVRGSPLKGVMEGYRVPVLLSTAALPAGWSPQVDTRRCRCLGASLSPDGQAIQAEVQLALRAVRTPAAQPAGRR